MKKAIFSLFVWLIATLASAVNITVSAPSHVRAGEQFRIEYKVNSDKVSNFKAPSFGGLEVLYGPAQSVQSSYQYINGKASHSSSTTFTFLVVADRPGTFVVGSATVSAGGGRARSKSLQITAGIQGSQRVGSRQGNTTESQAPAASSHISGSDLFITATASKQTVHEQEALLLTYKVYARMNVNLTQLDLKMPDLKGFHTQEIPLPQTKSWKLESRGGRQYKTILWSQYVLFPQQTGALTIPSIKANGIIALPNQNIDPLDAFFNTGAAYQEIKKTLVTPSMKINVTPLPTKPATFSGAVGKFNITASVNKQSIPANEALNLKVTVSGLGNLKLMKNPSIQFPKSFETYDPKVSDKDQVTSDGVSGTRVLNYTIIPRQQGDFEIPSIELCYFDLGSESYKTIRTQPFKIHVSKGVKGDGSVNDFDGDDAAQMKDIFDIETGKGDTLSAPADFFGKASYYGLLIALTVVFIALTLYFRERIEANADKAAVRGKKADKLAARRLKKAQALMTAGKSEEFYTEITHALWGYVADKLNIPVEELNKDNAAHKLNEAGVPDTQTSQFLSTLEECEFARFAPGDKDEKMDKLYKEASTVITAMDNALRNKK